MKRRTILEFGAATGLTGFGTILCDPAIAQPSEIIRTASNIIFSTIVRRNWNNIEVFRMISEHAKTLLEMRLASPPDSRFYDGPGLDPEQARAGLSIAYGENIEDGFNIGVPRVNQFLDSTSNDMAAQLSSAIRNRIVGFSEWMSINGVQFGNDEYVNFLGGQAYFAISVAAQIPESNGNINYFQKFTWIWPFC